MEINITRFFNKAAPMDYSASAAEIGNDAERVTWQAAVDDAPRYADLLDTEDKRAAFRAYVREFGAWSDEEIAAWSNTELTALFLQIIAGDMREADLRPGMTADEWRKYEARASDGDVAGHIYRGNDGRVWYYVGI